MDRVRYATPRAFEMAVTEAAKRSGQDVNKAKDDFYQGRLIERIFSEPNPSFVLKGGRSMLARYVDARRSRDSDLLFKGNSLQDAIDELKRIAAIDLDDYLEYRFVSAEPIAQDQDYRDGVKVVFTPVVGGAKSLNNVTIDLVLDSVFTGEAEVVSPTNRIEVPGLPVYDYLVLPVVNSICDKICAIMQRGRDGRDSSRVRDLSDLVVYISNEHISGDELSSSLAVELGVRGMERPNVFAVPEIWHKRYTQAYAKVAREAHLPDYLCDASAAEAFVKSCTDPVLAGEVSGMFWNPKSLAWE